MWRRLQVGMRFLVALSYSGRDELVRATRTLVRKVLAGELTADAIGESEIASQLDTAGLPDPDLLIRTSGELRVSNFLLWQIAYSEIWVSSLYWPEFRRRHLFEALLEYQRRDRRFGGVGSDANSSKSKSRIDT